VKRLLSQKPSVGLNRAVLIGINHYYLDDAIGNLNFCVDDVNGLDEVLTDELRGNFSTITLQSGNLDTKLLPNRSNILAMIKLLANNSEENDTILVYFAGHGFEQDGVNYLLPADARIDVLSETAITIKWIKDTLSKSLAKKKLLVIDACHAGSKLGRSSSISMSRSFQEELFQQSEGFAILSSCKIDQLSYDFEEKKHGAFSFFLLEGLQGSADDNEDNIITVPDANKYVSTKMREWCIKRGLQQNPTFSYNVSGDFIFVRVPFKNPLSFTFDAILEKAVDRSGAEEAKICEILDDIAFSSYEEIASDNTPTEQLTALVLQEENQERKIEKTKLFLKEFSSKRFSTKFATESLMTIVNKCLELKEIKKWIKQEEGIRKFLIVEFISSYNFNIAGTIAQIIEKLLPVLSDDEILEIVRNIKDNDQVTTSFKARSSLISIVDSCKSILPYKEYMALRSSILGS
jgi:hypothetical protein